MNTQIEKAANILIKARSVVALTGAGISVESGIPPFRGKGGLWEKIDPIKYAHIDAYDKNPAQVWEVLFAGLKKVLDKAKPNAGHLGLARLEEMEILNTVVTQNIDGLHQDAGSKDVIEFHGTFATLSCLDCGQGERTNNVDLANLPPRCSCGGILRPDVVMFGEMIPMDHLQRSQMLASSCDVMMVVGTSATVEPAAYLPVIAKRAGAVIIEINPDPTPLTRQVSDAALHGQAGQVMRDLLETISNRT